MKANPIHRLLAASLLLAGGMRAATITNSDPAPGAGVSYAHTVIMDREDSGSLSNHVGAWSWEDNALFGNAGQGTEPVGWTHTSRWIALKLEKDTVLTVAMERDATVPWPSGADPDRLADTSSMFPSFTLWRNWQNTGADNHSYNNRGPVSWAPDLEYLDHLDNSTQETVTRSIFLPAGEYSLALGSNAPANNNARQGFKVTFTTQGHRAVDPVPVAGGIGYGNTLALSPGESGAFSHHVGAWSWEDNALFGNAGQGTEPVGWTHTSRWVAVNLDQDAYFTITMERDATVPWPSGADPDRLADTSSMFPSFTLWRNWKNTGADNHSYNNRGQISWAPELEYLDHVDNATKDKVTRTWCLPAGQYSLVVGSNAPATNSLRQGFKLSYGATALSPIITGDPFPGGVGYAYIVSAGAGETGAFSTHVGAWSWEDNALFGNAGQGAEPVGWTHTSRWVALHVKEPLTFNMTMSRDATVPWPSSADPDRLADTSSMFPSLTLWRGWDNDGGDSHSYNNRGPVAWAEQLVYMDHIDNSTQTTITRSWTLPAGYYTFALGSNAPATNNARQGFRFEFVTTTPPAGLVPSITQHPKSIELLGGKSTKLTARARGNDLQYQWFRNGIDIQGATNATLEITNASTAAHAGEYYVRVRNTLGSVMSEIAHVTVLEPPVISPVADADLRVGQWVSIPLQVTGVVESFTVRNLPRGLILDLASRTITGMPTQVKDHTISITPRNKGGFGNTVQSRLIVLAALPVPDSGWNGILRRSSILNGNLGGSIRLHITSLGGISGSLSLGNTPAVPFAGSLSGASAVINLSSTRPELAGATLGFLFDSTAGLGMGTLTAGGEELLFQVARTLAVAGDLAGPHTFAMNPPTDELDDEKIFAGLGYGGYTISPTGMVRGSVILPDGSKGIFATALRAGRSIVLKVPFYRNQGSVLAEFAYQPGQTRLEPAVASWFKPADPAGSRNRLFREGVAPVTVIVVGGAYRIPTAGEFAMGLESAAPGQANANISFDPEGDLFSPSTDPSGGVFIPAGSTAKGVVPGANPAKLKITVNAGRGTSFSPGTTGSFKGSFEVLDPDPSRPGRMIKRMGKFQGMIVETPLGLLGGGFLHLPALPAAGQSPASTAILSRPVLLAPFSADD